MKKIKNLIYVSLVFVSLYCSSVESPAAPVQVSVSFQFFYDQLSPYGSWVSYPSYGYLWIPRGGPGFRPYFSNGHWAYTDSGWMWVSNYDWGWAPFHYGSWVFDPAYGWLWVPGYNWAPAWVEWGTYSGYYGWAPIGPRFSFGIAYYAPIEHWCFVQPRYMTVTDWGNHYYIARNQRISFSGNTAITSSQRISIVDNKGNYSNASYYSGPRKQEIERAANTSIRTATVQERSKPGRSELKNNVVSIYHPKVDAADRNSARPAKVTTLDKSRTSQRSSGKGNNTVEPSRQKSAPVKSRESVEQRKIQSQPEKSRTHETNAPREMKRNNAEQKHVASPSRSTQIQRPAIEPRRNNKPVEQNRNNNMRAPQQRTMPSQHLPMERSQPQPNPKHQGGGGRK